jgi:nucleotide-binding universal stress UspA family protein
MTKIIVSYDGTDNDRDALALGGALAGAGASIELAYVRHTHEAERGRERFAADEARALLERGAAALGQPGLPVHVVLSGSTAQGLRELAVSERADMIVFGSEYRTAPSHVDPQASARRLLDGGPVAIALAPAGFAENGASRFETIVAISEDGDPCAEETAESLAQHFGGVVARHAGGTADLLVIGSKPGTVTGRITISAAADYLIDLARSPVIVLPRGVPVLFGGGGG